MNNDIKKALVIIEAIKIDWGSQSSEAHHRNSDAVEALTQAQHYISTTFTEEG